MGISLGHYILVGHEAVRINDTLEWARKFGSSNRVVKQEDVGKYRVSTVFLGLDHQWTEGGPPRIFETMVFEGDNMSDLHCERYATWAEAEVGHDDIVSKIKSVTGD